MSLRVIRYKEREYIQRNCGVYMKILQEGDEVDANTLQYHRRDKNMFLCDPRQYGKVTAENIKYRDCFAVYIRGSLRPNEPKDAKARRLAALKAYKAMDQFLLEYEAAISRRSGDHGIELERSLWQLMRRHREVLPRLDGYFCKAFRQVDVTDDGVIDMVFHSLLYHAPVFWKLFEKHTLPDE